MNPIKLFFAITAITTSSFVFSQNVAINTTGVVANSSAILDISSTNSGLLIPRVALTATNAAGPITTPATSLLVYNTATASAGITAVTPGYYYWDGAQWVRFITGASPGPAWMVTGNAGTNPATHFAGTTDAVDFVIRTNNTEKMRITSGGNAGIGTSTPGYQLTLGGTGNVFGVENTSSFASKNNGGVYETYLWPRWSDNIMYLNYGAGGFNIRNNGSASTMFMTNANNVGITTTNPGFRLDLNTGTFGFGSGNVRTETRDNAGLQGTGVAGGAQSGFYETSNPSNYPAGATSWWHLIDSRHSNNANNYALQISGSFFDQNLYFRKTNNNPAQAWSQIWTTSNITCGTTNYLPKMTSATTMGCSQVYDDGTNVGIGTTAPAYKIDVQGGNGRINNVFLGDVGHGSGWGGWSHSLSANTSGYGILQSSDGSYTLINKQNTGGGYIGFRVANVDQAVILNNGNMGIGTTGPGTKLHVYADADNLPVIYGQNVNSTGGTTSYGVRGECGSSGLGSAGVSGVSTNSGQNEIGVVGDYSLWGASVFGLAWAAAYTDMPTTRDFGVFGTVNYITGTGVYGRNSNNTVGSAYGMYCFGNFAVTGAKSASIPTSQGNQLVYSMESPEVWFEDAGYSQLMNGSVHVTLSHLFQEAIFADNEHPFLIFTQEMGESQGLIVIPDADWKGFTVKEKNGGNSNISFSYRIMAKRRFYQDVKFGVDANQSFENNLINSKYVEPATTDPQVMKNWIDEQTRLKEEMMKKQIEEKQKLQQNPGK
jgi:hypothetical protein